LLLLFFFKIALVRNFFTFNQNKQKIDPSNFQMLIILKLTYNKVILYYFNIQVLDVCWHDGKNIKPIENG